MKIGINLYLSGFQFLMFCDILYKEFIDSIYLLIRGEDNGKVYSKRKIKQKSPPCIGSQRPAYMGRCEAVYENHRK